MFNLVIAEAAIELVPREIERHPSVRNDALRRDLHPSRILLDRSVHHYAMLKLEDAAKRGRPDLVHLTLLSITSTPLYQKGMVRVFIHTQRDVVLALEGKTRPPKSYSRFRDLVQKVLIDKPETGLISYSESSIPELLRRIRGDLVVGLSTQGKETSLHDVALLVAQKTNPVVLIGGFAKGHFDPQTVEELDEMFRIDAESLDAHVVAARLVYDVEKLLRGKN